MPVLDPDLQFRAAVASDLPMVVADAQSEDYVLVWVNPAFERVTGYRSADVVGRNCRFLQGGKPDRAVTRRIRTALDSGTTADETMLNYRADGTPFWNHVVISPMRNDAGELTHFVGVQADVTDLVEAETGRRAALARAQRANDRLRMVAAIDRQMDARLRLGQNVFEALPHILAAELPGWVVVAEIDAEQRVGPVVAHHSEPLRAEHAGELVVWLQEMLADRDSGAFVDAVQQLKRQEPVGVSLTAGQLDRAPDLPDGAFEPGQAAMILAVPLLSRGTLIGLLALAREGEQSFDNDDVSAIEDIAVRVSMALDIGRLYAAEHSAALTLQRSLLPRMPHVAGFDIAAAYQPAERSAEIGGDWYDVLDFTRPGIGVAIGDVMGHDLAAAAAMGQLRSVLRSYAWAGDRPADVLARLDELVRGLGMAAIATCFYATITPTDDPGVHAVGYASAGHPSPLVRRADGTVECLDASLTSPVGVLGKGPLPGDAHTSFAAGDVLVLYTDGLVESRVRDVQDGITDLKAALADAPAGSAQELCARLLAELRGATAAEDDTCLLVLRCEPPPA